MTQSLKRTILDDLDRKVIGLIQGDIPLERRPFASMAKKIGVTEEQFVRRVKDLKERSLLRRFGATLRHQEAGLSSNAMIAWFVPDGRVEEVGNILACFQEVTHCYQRKPQRDWHYNLYTMIHARNQDQCHRIAEEMSHLANIRDYELLFSEKEFKKTSMEYF